MCHDDSNIWREVSASFQVYVSHDAISCVLITMNTATKSRSSHSINSHSYLGRRIKAESEKQCRCQVEYQLVYVTSVNAFIKKAIERGELSCQSVLVWLHRKFKSICKLEVGVCACACVATFMQCYSGASNGITKNFETVQDVLKSFVTIRDASKAPAAKVNSLSDATG